MIIKKVGSRKELEPCLLTPRHGAFCHTILLPMRQQLAFEEPSKRIFTHTKPLGPRSITAGHTYPSCPAILEPVTRPTSWNAAVCSDLPQTSKKLAMILTILPIAWRPPTCRAAHLCPFKPTERLCIVGNAILILQMAMQRLRQLCLRSHSQIMSGRTGIQNLVYLRAKLVFGPLHLVAAFNWDDASSELHDDCGTIYTRVQVKSPPSQSTQRAQDGAVEAWDLMSRQTGPLQCYHARQSPASNSRWSPRSYLLDQVSYNELQHLSVLFR